MTKEGTVWGTLKLVENPKEPATPGFEGPVGKKVPRTILLRGKVSFLVALLALVARRLGGKVPGLAEDRPPPRRLGYQQTFTANSHMLKLELGEGKKQATIPPAKARSAGRPPAGRDMKPFLLSVRLRLRDVSSRCLECSSCGNSQYIAKDGTSIFEFGAGGRKARSCAHLPPASIQHT